MLASDISVIFMKRSLFNCEQMNQPLINTNSKSFNNNGKIFNSKIK